MRGAFIPRNTLGSTAPSFTERRPRSPDRQCLPPRIQHSEGREAGDSSPPHEGTNESPDSIRDASIALDDFGNSSSLFSYSSPASFDFGSAVKGKDNSCPVPFVFGIHDYTPARKDQRKMVNERSPAKVPLKPASPNGQMSRSVESPPSAPVFGVTSLPQSPLVKQTQREKSVFIQPKTRPEHHREIAHPHLQALKDVTRKVVDPLVARAADRLFAPSADAVPVAAPRPQQNSYTTTEAAPPQTFSSMGNTYGGFQSVNNGYTGNMRNNHIDLTMNLSYASPEPYSYVDPVKAQEDLKALLEGAMDDEDDLPRSKTRRKRRQAQLDDLTAKLGDLKVQDEKLDVLSEDEDEEDDGSVDGIKVKLLPHQVDGLEWMKSREMGTGRKGAKVPKGGILADDMGLGKTLQSISLIMTNPKPTDEDTIAKRKLPSGIERTTLVVAPLALIRQWELEINDKIARSHALRVCVHHGPQRTKRFSDLKKFDVVITTYQILVSEFGGSSKEEGGLKVGCFGLHWYRVILDEAHTIKNRNAKATQACYALRSEYRWCLTGTPMQNNLDELQSLIKFLRIGPYDNLGEWREQIDGPMKRGRGDLAIKRLRAVLRVFMKRRTKDILKEAGALNPGGKPSAEGEASSTGFKVTERRIEKISAEFSAKELHFYKRLEARADASIEEMMSGKVNYASALVLLLRLRQACNHPKLVAGKLTIDSEALAVERDSKKAKSSNADVDEIADLFGAMAVGSKKCEVCQLELGKTAVAEGAVRCLDCENDLEEVEGRSTARKEKKKTHKRHDGKKSEGRLMTRKPRNRNVVLDSDDEDEDAEGSWIVPERQRGALRLGKAGGIADENAEGGGEWLNSEDDTFPDLDTLRSQSQTIKEEDQDSSEGSDSDATEDVGSDSAVEEEVGNSSDEGFLEEERQLSKIATSTKINHLLEILKREAHQHKFIVFSQFTSMLDLIEPFLKQKGYKYTRYDGKMRNDMREASLSRLRNDKNCRILLCSLKCGSLGLNLTAATRVVILEPFWNPFVEEQAIDRVHRLTQKIDVVVYKITIRDSVEERILDLQEKKRELAHQTIEGGAKSGAGKLGMKELLQLFGKDAERVHLVPKAAVGEERTFDMSKPRVLMERQEIDRGSGRTGGSVDARRAGSPALVGQSGKCAAQPKAKEDAVYGRRW